MFRWQPFVRSRPNILITCTPGTGKSTLATHVAEQMNMELIDVARIVKENNYYEQFDEQYQCHVLDEDKLLDHIEDRLLQPCGGCVVDYHSCELFAERWFDLVLVLRTDNAVLYDRLAARGYGQHKLSENVQCEIFGTIADEARESYKHEIVVERGSNTPDDMQQNGDWLEHWVQHWHTSTS